MKCGHGLNYLLILLFPFQVAFAFDDRPILKLDADFGLVNLEQMPCPKANAAIQYELCKYSESNAVEWQVRLDASESKSSVLYNDLKSADFILEMPNDGPIDLHWSRGSHGEAIDFRPETDRLPVNQMITRESFGGRSSDGTMPYFNIACEGGGLIVAVGWTGDWTASFEALGNGKVRIASGLKRTHFKIHSKEKLRLPSLLLMGYKGDWIDGQNQFRRLLLDHFTPKNHPAMTLMPVAASVHGMFGFNETTQENLTALATDVAALKLPLDTFWLDAGWNEGGFPAGQGNPNADAKRFPEGLRTIGETVNKSGMRFLAWFEPERAMRGSWLDREHQDWLLLPSNIPPQLHYMEKDGFRLVDMGNQIARDWMLKKVSEQVRESGISIYRQDFNEYPSYFWHNDEAADEVGLREIRYVNGLYDYLDELARQHPTLIIDNCASGGRRLDFEMMRRSVVLWRSDSCWDDKLFPRNVQAMSYGLSLWLPLHGLGAVSADNVALRSGMGACATFAINYRDPVAVKALRDHLTHYMPVRSLFATNFYPLNQWTDGSTKWIAFQFHDPEKDAGIVQAFCGPGPVDRSITIRLKGLDPNRLYTVIDWDKAIESSNHKGIDLAVQGLQISSQEKSTTAIVLQYSPAK